LVSGTIIRPCFGSRGPPGRRAGRSGGGLETRIPGKRIVVGHGWRVVISVRTAAPGDGPELQRIERLAGEQFRSLGMDAVADDPPLSVAELAVYANAGRSWVALDDGGDPVGYVIADEVDGDAHIAQMSVRPDWQGRGVGRELLERVRTWAIDSKMTAISLTTYAEVPWNRPLYEHLGFRVLHPYEIGPDLKAIRTGEGARGLDLSARVCMRLDVGISRQ
jgi:GNAT superfamily N-acetyltransferase